MDRRIIVTLLGILMFLITSKLIDYYILKTDTNNSWEKPYASGRVPTWVPLIGVISLTLIAFGIVSV